MTIEELKDKGIKMSFTFTCSDGKEFDSASEAISYEKSLWENAINEQLDNELDKLFASYKKKDVIKVSNKKVDTSYKEHSYIDTVEEPIYSQICRILLDKFIDETEVPYTTFYKDTVLMDDLGLDSFDMVEFVMELEKKFNIYITDEQSERLFTLENVYDIVKAKVESQDND